VLDRTDLVGADLRGATGLTQAQLNQAYMDRATKLPEQLGPDGKTLKRSTRVRPVPRTSLPPENRIQAMKRWWTNQQKTRTEIPLADLKGSPDWLIRDGILINSGTDPDYPQGASWLPLAPYGPVTPDYAVEASMRIIDRLECRGGFGISVCMSDQGGYAAGVKWSEGFRAGFGRICIPVASIFGPNGPLATADFDPGHDRVTYRITVRDQSIQCLVDGKLLLDATNDRFGLPGDIGLWCHHVELEVSRICVIA
jgi:hypothetical protein